MVSFEKMASAEHVPFEIEELFFMLRIAKENKYKPDEEKLIHIIKIFKFLMQEKMKKHLIVNIKFRNNIKNKIRLINRELCDKSISYFIAIEYYNTADSLKKYICSIEESFINK